MADKTAKKLWCKRLPDIGQVFLERICNVLLHIKNARWSDIGDPKHSE